MPRPLPTCKNAQCARYRSNAEMVVIQERPADVTFGCRCCSSIQVVTLDWRRGNMELEHQRYGRPEWARNKAYFFQGKRA